MSSRVGGRVHFLPLRGGLINVECMNFKGPVKILGVYCDDQNITKEN